MIQQEMANPIKLSEGTQSNQGRGGFSQTSNACGLGQMEHANWRRSCAPILAFESRGRAMLKAALKERNKARLAKLPGQEIAPPSLFEQKARRIAQQVEELNKRKRSPKNNVLFTEPLVTQQFEYEPDILFIDGKKGDAECLEMTDEEIQAEHEALLKCFGCDQDFGSSLNDDEDDELFTLARSDILNFEEIKDQEKKGNPKRTYETMKDSDDEDECDLPPGQFESSGGGLFSSPKVAKIAPYFDDQYHERQVPEGGAIARNRDKTSTDNQRSRSISYRNSSTKDGSSFIAKKIEAKSNRSRDRTTELLSYKKFSSPNVKSNVIQEEPATDSDTLMDDRSGGYFGWLTTFLTNQMNKLIF